jgi:putative SOS response-associated peptidase YedK
VIEINGLLMCSIITVSSQPGQLGRYFRDLQDPEGLDSRGVEVRAHGFLKKETSPVVLSHGGGRPIAVSKFFSLCPHWSKAWPFEFETYNARLSRPKKVRDKSSGQMRFVTDPNGAISQEYIYSVPSFRDAFNSGRTCLVPVSGAVESCYFGESAGHIVRFSPQNDSLLFALGLWNDWVNPESGEVFPTFTLLTDDPDEYVFRHGHDRGIIIIDPARWSDWLGQSRMSGLERFRFIRQNRVQPMWRTEIERPLKQGWMRRAPTTDEIESVRVWKP